MVSLLALPEGGEWVVILVIVVLLFGAKKLPELTRNAARAMVEFKKVTNGEDDDKPQVEPKPADPRSARPEGANEEPRGV
jgi:sec-independent protein translocase protein TatA